MFETIIVLALFGLIVGSIAKGKGRSFGVWFIYGALLFIIALIHSLTLKDVKEDTRQCDACFKAIDYRAIRCPFCQAKQGTQAKEAIKVHEEKQAKKDKHQETMVIVLIVIVVICYFLFRYGFLGHF